jgi:hypothetical protein
MIKTPFLALFLFCASPEDVTNCVNGEAVVRATSQEACRAFVLQRLRGQMIGRGLKSYAIRCQPYTDKDA